MAFQRVAANAKKRCGDAAFFCEGLLTVFGAIAYMTATDDDAG
jgi:hypothetical protein